MNQKWLFSHVHPSFLLQLLGDIKRDYHEEVDLANDEMRTLERTVATSIGKDDFQKTVSPKLQII